MPIYEQRNDGRDNLLGALVIAGHYVIPEVSTLFLRAAFPPELVWPWHKEGDGLKTNHLIGLRLLD